MLEWLLVSRCRGWGRCSPSPWGVWGPVAAPRRVPSLLAFAAVAGVLDTDKPWIAGFLVTGNPCGVLLYTVDAKLLRAMVLCVLLQSLVVAGAITGLGKNQGRERKLVTAETRFLCVFRLFEPVLRFATFRPQLEV